MKKPEAAYREYLLESSIPDKLELIRKKTESGYVMSQFHKSGNGMKTLLQATGRLTDFQGIFIITSYQRAHLVLGESIHVLSEIQQLSRAQRVKDKELLDKIARHYNRDGFIQGQELLNTAEVNWIEVASKAERALLMKSLRSMPLFILR